MIFNKTILIALTSVALISCASSKEDKGTITINNKSPYPVSEVSVEYKSSNKKDSIGNLEPNASYKYEIKYSNTEDSIYINYLDRNKKYHSELVVPYSAKYDKQTYTFDIK
ncbi:hypothetical protein HCY58_11730 [Acinetobacter radioresistens]|uniref:hypothetical protein n=1 Tax=Acinetobacter radioresistens TaxID=40216 RepID=UPI0020055B9C|nr:hypothetical protein [Acinetobacter radioresistens]MCK4087716.1 hypothetical protein [Acinetobacter radioresistens]MCK4093499.1 hypothetical protein [Acinetobacter radioresistens]